MYPGIDPSEHYKKQTYKGKVVLITGASRGIGEEVALFYARAGASLSLLARSQASLDGVRNSILKEIPEAKVLAFITDVTSTLQVKAAVDGTLDAFGRIDIVIANAGRANTFMKR